MAYFVLMVILGIVAVSLMIVIQKSSLDNMLHELDITSAEDSLLDRIIPLYGKRALCTKIVVRELVPYSTGNERGSISKTRTLNDINYQQLSTLLSQKGSGLPGGQPCLQGVTLTIRTDDGLAELPEISGNSLRLEKSDSSDMMLDYLDVPESMTISIAPAKKGLIKYKSRHNRTGTYERASFDGVPGKEGTKVTFQLIKGAYGFVLHLQ